jgi:hypothetical protein
VDLQLRVGGEDECDIQDIRCHQIILIMNSPVFESMLSERWNQSLGQDLLKESTKELTTISIPEIDPGACKIVLKVSHCVFIF